MNAHGSPVTTTQAAAIERRRAFQQAIADSARRLAESKVPRAPAHTPEFGLPEFYFYVSEVPETIKIGVPTIREIQVAVAKHYRLSVDDLLSARRELPIVIPRQVAYFLTRELTNYSMPAIGRKFGGRDHTSVLHGARKIRALVDAGDNIARDVAALRAEIARKFMYG